MLSTTKTLAIELLRLDGNTQNRLAINEDVVEDYTQIIADAYPEWPLGPLDVFHDGSDYFVGDGFHRTLAGVRAKRGSIPCKIHKGTAKDARIFGMTANDRHGLRMSRADKRACVEWLLDNDGKLTQAAIAEKAGVSKRTVKRVVAERNPESVAETSTPPKGMVTLSPSTPIGGGSETIGKPEPDEPIDVDSEPVDDPPEPDDEEDSEVPSPPKKPKTKPPKVLDRKAYYKQWDQAIGPICRLVDKIANDVGEKGCPSHKTVQGQLEACTEEMAEWLGVGLR